jgi:phospholipase C
MRPRLCSQQPGRPAPRRDPQRLPIRPEPNRPKPRHKLSGLKKLPARKVIFVFWDDYGSWYDHVPPPLANYDGLGIRVPLLIVSAYAKEGYISDVVYNHGSILKFIEGQWGLASLSESDARANPISPKCFDFLKPPRLFTKIPVKHDQPYFLAQPLDTRPPDTE